MNRSRWRIIRRIALSATVLKCVNLFLVLLICFDAPRLIATVREWHRYFETVRMENELKSRRNASELRWSQVDISHPPPLFDAIIEAMRINELLAGSIADTEEMCKKRTRHGNDSDTFILCEDDQFIITNSSTGSIKALLLTNRENLRGTFERSLKLSSWSIYAPSRCNIFDLLIADIEVNHLKTSKANPNEYQIPVTDLITDLERRKFAIAKIDLFYMKTQSIHNVLRALLPEIKTEQLLLVIHLERLDTSLLFRWYSLLFEILSEAKFLPLNAESSGACGTDLEHFGHCEYRITFLHRDNIAQRTILAPAFGLGSPIEEKYRLLKYLINIPREKENLCQQKVVSHFDQIPLPCQTNRHPAKKCASMVYIRYRMLPNQDSWNWIAQEIAGTCDEIHLIYPHNISNTIITPSSMRHHQYAVSCNDKTGYFPIDPFNESSAWKLEQLDDLLQRTQIRTYMPNILVIDLDGGEWTIINNFLKNVHDNHACAKFRNFEQIIIRLRIWRSEEGRNYRKIYSGLSQLEKGCDFSKVYSISYDPSTYGLIFYRNKILVK